MPGSITIADVARKAGVSTATVSRVINQTAPVIDETEQRVRAAIAELGYTPQAAARSLASRHTNNLGILLPEISADFFSMLLRGVEQATYDAGYDLLIATQREDQPKRDRPQPLGKHNTDGLLVFIGNLGHDQIEQLHRSGLPMVMLYESAPEGLGIPMVTVENRQGAQDVVEHLISVHGKRRILYLSGPEENEDSSQREQGYRDALKAHGIPFDPGLVVFGDFNEETSQQAVLDALDRRLDFDSIFGGSDEAAIGAVWALNQRGIPIPSGMAVVGFDDLRVSRYLSSPLTTVRAPIEQVGSEAARLLVQLIQTGEAELVTRLPVTMILRSSCGCTM
ncbi:MAG TPA: LacI family DNA-binding transcriptional regulator [Longilinea sp.]|nr:LacI family DNA-binding transcriptional regulator [Longilinea sp.]